MNLVNSVRNMFGLRRKRTLPLPGPKPRFGAKIVKDDLRMTVQAGLTDGTWQWLIDQGWREQTYRNDRRVYRDVPASRVAQFLDADDPITRGKLLRHAVAEAEIRPVVTLPPRR
jgi:hypothetical protein